MRKLNSILFALFLLAAANLAGFAQETEKKESEKTTTIDAWRQAMPQNEQPAYKLTPDEQAAEVVEAAETPEQIEKKVSGLEVNFLEALKMRDSAALNNLLADDFAPVGISLKGKSDKNNFIDWAMKNLQIKSYAVNKTSFQIFPSTAIVTTSYKRSATVADAPSDGDFLVTDVWIKRGKNWQAVSHHISQLPTVQTAKQ